MNTFDDYLKGFSALVAIDTVDEEGCSLPDEDSVGGVYTCGDMRTFLSKTREMVSRIHKLEELLESSPPTTECNTPAYTAWKKRVATEL